MANSSIGPLPREVGSAFLFFYFFNLVVGFCKKAARNASRIGEKLRKKKGRGEIGNFDRAARSSTRDP